MASPTIQVLKYADVIQIKAGSKQLGSNIVTGNVMQMKTKGVGMVLNSKGVSVLTTFDDLIYVDVSTTYTFDKDCVLAICNMVEII